MNAQRPIPTPTVTDWGFFGTMDRNADEAWPLAMTAIAAATGEPLESVRLFLDSRHGRHFADDVHNQLLRGLPLAAAIEAATRQWMSWSIGRRTSRDYGIPMGLPYLTGFVVQCAIEDEAIVA